MMSRQSARAVSERAWRTKRDLSKSFSEETSRAREPVRDLGAKTQIYVGGMAEWSMAVVLKTTVRETVPGVRIPLPPPDFTDLYLKPKQTASAIHTNQNLIDLRAPAGTARPFDIGFVF